jgi:FlaA1/EpsC-like NDP-sugar epimerase
MGTPIKIADIARDMIRLSGFEPETDIQINYVGLRPGEKLYEELITDGEGIVPTDHNKIMVLRADGNKFDFIEGYLEKLEILADQHQGVAIMKLFKKIVPEYMPPNDYQELENKIRLCQ